jgi:sugar lactone lactonase YvrE
VRSQAKASSAGTNHCRPVGMAVSFLLLALALAPSAASAAKVHVPASFSPIDGSGTGVTLHRPSGIAVDETSGNVFVNDGLDATFVGGNVVDVFGAEGGVPTGVASPYQLTGFAFYYEPTGVAVDNSATSPSKGALYVADLYNGEVKKFVRNAGTEKYEAEGKLIPSTGPFFEYPYGVAVDSHGNVFVAEYGSASVVKFSPTGTELARIDTSASVGHPGSIALDAAGDLFVQSYDNSSVYKYPANGAGQVEAGKFTTVFPEAATGVAVDPATNALYVTRNNRVYQLNATSLASEGEFGAGVLSTPERLAVNSKTGRIYVSDAAESAQHVVVFDTVTVPDVTTGEVTGITTAAATLHGTVNPDGVALEECSFEYGTSTSYGQSVPCAESSVSIGTGKSRVQVHADVSGLAIGTVYHFRLSAKNANGAAKGSDQSFSTAGPPEIHDDKATDVHDTSAKLEAKIYPGRQLTTYHFEYVSAVDFSQSGYAKATSLPPGGEAIGSGAVDVPIVQQISALTPATTYHFRTIATNASGSVEGADRTFTTFAGPPSFEACPNDGFRSGYGASLPDCRAFEQASPVDKDGQEARGYRLSVRASVNGDAVSFVTANGIPGGVGGQELPTYLASRGAGAWSTQGLLPPTSVGSNAKILGWTRDFSQVFSFAKRESGPQAGLGGLTFLSRSSADGSLATIVPYGSEMGDEPRYIGASPDGSRVVFESLYKLPTVPAAIAGKPNVYIWDRASGTLSLAGVLNDGQAPAGGAIAGRIQLGQFRYDTHYTHTISADASSVFFTTLVGGKLYLRRNPTEAQSPLDGNGKCTDPALACTIEVSATQKNNGLGGGPDAAGTRPATFMAATPDGSKAFFTSSEKLTNDATTGSEPDTIPAIASANTNGSGANFNFLPTHVFGVTVDGSHVYWTNPKAGTIGRAKLEGNGVTEVKEDFITGAGSPQYVAVDAEHIYWTNDVEEATPQEGKSTIGRAKKSDGSGVKLDFITGAYNPRGIAVGSEHIYWANAATNHPLFPNIYGDGAAIGRAKIDGSGAEQKFIEAEEEHHIPWGIAVNATSIYWTDNSRGFESYVFRRNLDGKANSEKLLFVDGASLNEEAGLHGIALDATHVYWGRQGSDTIGRANLDLEVASREPELITDAGKPEGLALDGTHLYWSANQEVQPNLGNDLYRYDADTGELIDIAPDVADENGAEVRGVLGTSNDGSFVYFAANGDLDGAGPAAQGDCHRTGSFGDSEAGTCNLYLAHEGTTTFIARLDVAVDTDRGNWNPAGPTARVSADGHTLLFVSGNQLTSYDNKGTRQLYRYHLGDPSPTCVSCNPIGVAPVEGVRFGSIHLSFLVPQAPVPVFTRNLSASGDRVFFETTDSLLAADSNGDGGCPQVGPPQGKYSRCLDVYEWEANGSGSCHSEAQNGGCLYLLSPPNGSETSFFADASASGDDVFLYSRSQLVGQDKDQLMDLYDVRVGGGLTSQNPPTPPVPCEGEACKAGAGAVPLGESPGTERFAGPSNPKPVHKKAKKNKKAKKKRRHQAKKHHKRNAKHARAHR